MSAPMPVATSVLRRCSSCISIAMSNSFLRSASVRTTSGSDRTLSGLVSSVLPSTTERIRCRSPRARTGRDCRRPRRRTRRGLQLPPAPTASCAERALRGRTTRPALASGLTAASLRRPALTAASGPAKRRRRRRLHAQIPARRLDAGAVHARERRPRDFAHVAAGCVGDLQRQAGRPASSGSHEMIAACGGFSPRNVWLPQNS